MIACWLMNILINAVLTQINGWIKCRQNGNIFEEIYSRHLLNEEALLK
jgi:hypothetical protein